MPGSAGSRRTEHGGGRRRRKLKAPCPILYGREGKSRKIIENAGCGRSVAEESGAVLVAGGILGREARKVRRISGKGGFQHLSAENAPDCRILPENCATKAPTEAPTEVVRELPWTLLGTLGRKHLLNGHGGRFRGNVAERPERNDRNGRCRGVEPVPSVRRSATAKRGRNRRTVFTAQPPDGQPQGGVKSAGGTGMGGRLRERRESGDRNAGA